MGNLFIITACVDFLDLRALGIASRSEYEGLGMALEQWVEVEANPLT